MRHLTRTLMTLCVLALLAPAGAVAAEPWGAAKTLDIAKGRNAIGFGTVGVDDRGGAVVAWLRGNRRTNALLATQAPAGRLFGRSLVLAAGRHTIDSPTLAFDGERNAVVAYRRYSGGTFRVEARSVRPSGTLTARQILSTTGGPAFLPEFVQPTTDRPLLFWSRGTGEPDIQISRATGSGTFSETTAYDVEGATADFHMTADDTGAVYAAIVRRDPVDKRFRVYVARQAPGETAVALTPVSDGVQVPREPRIIAPGGGPVTVVWSESNGTAERVVTTVRQPDGSYSAPTEVAPSGGFVSSLKIVETEAGIVAGWLASTKGPAYRARAGALHLAFVSRGTAPERVSRAGERVSGFAIDSDGHGGATLGWVTDVPRRAGGPVNVLAIQFNGTLGRLWRLTRPRERALTLSIDSARRGHAIAAWVTSDLRALRVARRPGDE